MFEQLSLIEGSSDHSFKGDELALLQGFELKTCQRTLVLSLNQPQALEINQKNQHLLNLKMKQDAYGHLLTVVCGLSSRLLGETEIVAQYRKALTDYTQKSWRNNQLLRILERILKDAKEIRHQHLQQVGQFSYAGLTKKILQERNESGPVLILGSGAMAEDMAKIMAKHFDLFILARNQERLQTLKSRYRIEILSNWENCQHSLKHYAFVINTIPEFANVLGIEALKQWFFAQELNEKAAWIDLGQSDKLHLLPDFQDKFFAMSDLLAMGALLSRDKESKIASARTSIEQIVAKRYQLSSQDHGPASSDDVEFAHANFS